MTQPQCTNLELSQELKQLGYPQESYFWHVRLSDKPDGTQDWYLRDRKPSNYEERVAAPTVAELGEKLPTFPSSIGEFHSGKCNGGKQYQCSYTHWGNLWHDRQRYESEKLRENFVADTEADARAKMLIYLLKNNLIEL